VKGKTSVSFRIDEPIIEKLRNISYATRRSLNDIMEDACSEFVRMHEFMNGIARKRPKKKLASGRKMKRKEIRGAKKESTQKAIYKENITPVV
jgi:predicted transcriptional regulator